MKDFARKTRRSLTLPLTLTFAGTFLLLSFGNAGNAQAGSAQVTVSATVLPRASLSVLSQQRELTVTDTDIRLGYVEAVRASRVEVRTNSHEGYLLVFEGLGGPFKAARVTGLANETEIAAGGGWIPQPYAGPSGTVVEVSYRFALSRDAQPGVYPFPLSLSATPR